MPYFCESSQVLSLAKYGKIIANFSPYVLSRPSGKYWVGLPRFAKKMWPMPHMLFTSKTKLCQNMSKPSKYSKKNMGKINCRGSLCLCFDCLLMGSILDTMCLGLPFPSVSSCLTVATWVQDPGSLRFFQIEVGLRSWRGVKIVKAWNIWKHNWKYPKVSCDAPCSMLHDPLLVAVRWQALPVLLHQRGPYLMEVVHQIPQYSTRFKATQRLHSVTLLYNHTSSV